MFTQNRFILSVFVIFSFLLPYIIINFINFKLNVFYLIIALSIENNFYCRFKQRLNINLSICRPEKASQTLRTELEELRQM